MKFKATFRIIASEEIEAPTLEVAKKLAEAKVSFAIQTEGMDWAELADIKQTT